MTPVIQPRIIRRPIPTITGITRIGATTITRLATITATSLFSGAVY